MQRESWICNSNSSWWLRYHNLYMENLLILTREPFVGFRPEDIRSWLKTNPTESNYAIALSEIQFKVSDARDDVFDVGDVWSYYVLDEWEKLETEIVEYMQDKLVGENQNGAMHDLSKPGWRHRILPFMERNGYRDASGWWIKVKPNNN